jgi:hypothetical protein
VIGAPSLRERLCGRPDDAPDPKTQFDIARCGDFRMVMSALDFQAHYYFGEIEVTAEVYRDALATLQLAYKRGEHKGEHAQAHAVDLARERALSVLAVLAKADAPLTWDALRKAVRGKADVLMRAIDYAIHEGWIEQRFSGKRVLGYVLTDAGREVDGGMSARYVITDGNREEGEL